MTQTKRALRHWASSGHRWLGIFAGILFCLMAITGSLLAFRPQIEAATMPKLPQASSCATFHLDAAMASIDAFRPESKLDRITFPRDLSSPYIFELAQPRAARIAYDACSHRVLATVNL